MKSIILSTLLLTTLTFSQACTVKFQYINGRKMMSNCAWKQHLKIKEIKPNFHKTIKAESLGKFDAVNINDLGKPAYGYVQFRGTYAKILETQLGFTKRTSLQVIKRKLRSKKGVRLQQKLFRKKFIEPVIEFSNKRHITDIKVIELLVDWRVNGMPKRYCNKVTRFSTVQDVIKLRKKYYRYLHKKNPKRYTRRLYLAWLDRLNKFM